MRWPMFQAKHASVNNVKCLPSFHFGICSTFLHVSNVTWAKALWNHTSSRFVVGVNVLVLVEDKYRAHVHNT